MPRIFLALGIFLSLVSWCSPSFSHSVFAICPGTPVSYSYADGQKTQDDAKSVALNLYKEMHKSVCPRPMRFLFFSATCMGLFIPLYGTSGDHRRLPAEGYFTATGSNQEVNSQMHAICPDNWCSGITVLCDTSNSGVSEIDRFMRSFGHPEGVSPKDDSAPPEESSKPRETQPPAPPPGAKSVDLITRPPAARTAEPIHSPSASAPVLSGPNTKDYPDSLDVPVQDTRSLPDIQEIKTVAQIAATLAISALVVIQLISLIRTGRRRPDFLFQGALRRRFRLRWDSWLVPYLVHSHKVSCLC